MEKRARNVNIDLTKSIAVFFVLSVHFFYHNGFYKTLVNNSSMYLMMAMRTAFMVCVPLFLITTGFLMSEKKLSLRYYKGITHTLFIYLAASFCCMAVVHFKETPYTWHTAIQDLIDFTGAPYAWYVEMYIGLFLLIPFLNLIYRNLEGKRQKQILILTLFILTSLTSLINTSSYFVPAYWLHTYPLLYYFIGCYLKEYPVQWKRKHVLLLFFCLWVALCAAFNIYRSGGGKYEWGMYADWYGFENVISAALLFAWLQSLSINRMPGILKKVLACVSRISLGIYLVSWIFDQKFYEILNTKVPVMTDRLFYYFVIVPAVFLCSFLTALLLDWICRLLQIILSWAIRKIRIAREKKI